MKSALLLALALWVSNGVLAQTPKLDSLQRAVLTKQSPEAESITWQELAVAFIQAGDLQRGQDAATQAMRLAKKAGSSRALGYAHYAQAAVYEFQGNYTTCIPAYREAIKWADLSGESLHALKCSNNLGSAYMAVGQPDSASAAFRETYRKALKLNLPYFSAVSQLNLGIIASMQSRPIEAIQHFQRGKSFVKPDSHAALHAYFLLNLGYLFRDVQSPREAKVYFQQAADLLTQCQCDGRSLGLVLYQLASMAEEVNIQLRLIQKAREAAEQMQDIGTLTHLEILEANLALKANNLPQAWVHVEKALGNAEQTSEQEVQITTYLAASEYYLLNGSLNQARIYANKSIKLAQQVGAVASIKMSHKMLYQVDSAQGRFEQALYHHQQFKHYTDSLRNRDNAYAVGRLEADHAAQAQKERARMDRERANVQLNQARLMFGGALVGVALLGALAFTLFRSRRQARRSNLELKNMYNQILSQKSKIEQINSELISTLEEVTHQRQLLTVQHTKIEDSIRYASRIQSAILPEAAQLRDALPAYFIHY